MWASVNKSTWLCEIEAPCVMHRHNLCKYHTPRMLCAFTQIHNQIFLLKLNMAAEPSNIKTIAILNPRVGRTLEDLPLPVSNSLFST